MARKNILKYDVAIAQSLGATFTSTPTVVKSLDNASYQINAVTSDAVGIFTVQVSNDYNKDEPSNTVTNPGSWADLTLSGTPTLASANDTIVIDLNQLPFTAIRIKYTRTSGTGTCDIILVARQIGG